MAFRTLFDGSAAPEPAAGSDPLTVSQLVAALKRTVEPAFRDVWVEGEVADFRGIHGTGHAYFALKDAVSMVRAKMWRSDVARLKFELESGTSVVAHGKAEIYAPRGELSITVDRMHPVGLGQAAAAFEQLRKKLLAEGLFESGRKRPLPLVPRALGLVTSREGAAIRDFLRHLKERWPVRVVLAHSAVQGAGADRSVAEAIALLSAESASRELDAIALIRGGGGMEDLMAFNSELVARAIAACCVPVVTGIGHEIDVTIADLVADLRAKTPTDAANVLVPDRREVRRDLGHLRDRLGEAVDRTIEELRSRWLSTGLASPADLLSRFDAEVESLARLLQGSARERILSTESEMERLRARLAAGSPRVRVADRARLLEQAGRELLAAGGAFLARAESRLGVAAAKLDGTSPLAILGRGYSLTRRRGERKLLVDASALKSGDAVETRLAKGSFVSRVESIERPRDGSAT